MSNKGQFKKGQSGNPLGRPKTSAKDLVRMHPQKNELVQKLFDVAMDDGDKRQVSAWRILLPKMVPDLKAMQMEVEQKNITGVIVLPPKVELDPKKISTSGQSESETFLNPGPGDVSQAESQANGHNVGTNQSSPREGTRLQSESSPVPDPDVQVSADA
tara:strand:- start:14263 stop:14739 length:477 start_codon:yes stop_codon:yes gene_type:complete